MPDSTPTCACGCGATIPVGNRYLRGHATKVQWASVKRYEVDPGTGCWNWLLSTNPKGYPTLGGAWWKKTRRSILAHRIAWEEANDAIVPLGYTVDHLCRNRKCVNPAHLEAVPHATNVQRGSRAKLSPADVQSVLRHIAEGQSSVVVGAAHGITSTQVRAIVRGLVWTDLPCSYRRAAQDAPKLVGRAARAARERTVEPYPQGEAA